MGFGLAAQLRPATAARIGEPERPERPETEQRTCVNPTNKKTLAGVYRVAAIEGQNKLSLQGDALRRAAFRVYQPDTKSY
jgi:hypothetical protein